jgi:hypothetical protein
MRPLFGVALSGLIVAGSLGCSKSVDSKVKSFIYPLAMGNQWVYDCQTITDFRGKKPNDTVTYSIAVTVVGVDTILPGVYSYTIRATSVPPDEKTPSPEKRYVNLPDGMYVIHTHTGLSSLALPKQRERGPSVMFRGRQYQDLRALLTSLIGPLGVDAAGQSGSDDSFSLVLPYPQSRGQRWTCTQVGDDHPFGVDKQITGSETVKNSAGSFDCHVIRWIYDPPMEDLDVLDFTSAEGLIRRRVEAHDMVISDYQYPYGGDTADVVFTHELTSLQLH